MTYVGTAHCSTRLENLVELFEYAPGERRLLRFSVDSKIVTSRVDRYVERSFDESERRFAVAVEGDSGRVIVESQALEGCCLFPSQ